MGRQPVDCNACYIPGAILRLNWQLRFGDTSGQKALYMEEVRLKDRKEHWEKVYGSKPLHACSWYEAVPAASLTWIRVSDLPLDAHIVDVGGGDSLLVDSLLDRGFANITVVDISRRALDRARMRLGPRSDLVQWIESDITRYEPDGYFDLWHDRAAFHFLTRGEDVNRYADLAARAIRPEGRLIIGTFSPDGPKSCSELPVQSYSEESMYSVFSRDFALLA